MNILITGIHGFVGSSLVEVISTGNTVYGVDIVAPVVSNVSDTFSWNDVDNGKIPAVDAIIHLAGISHECRKKSEEQTYIDVNYGLTKKIYDKFTEGNAGVFIFFSSVKAVSNGVTDGEVLVENAEYNSSDVYGRSKAMAEQYIIDNMPSESSGKKVYILRPCMIHGPECKGNFRLLYNYVKSGYPWPFGSFENRRSYTSIDNIKFVVKSLLNGTADSGVYNVCDDDPVATNDVLRIISGALNRKVMFINVPKWLVVTVAGLGGFLHLPVNTGMLRKITGNFVVSNAKIKNALCINNMPVSAETGFLNSSISFKNKV